MGRLNHNHLLSVLVPALLFLLVMPPAGGTAAAAGDEAELFERAYNLYLSYQPERAASAFDVFIKEFPESSALDAAFFWKAKSLGQSGRTEEAGRLFSSFAEKFPDSPLREFIAGEQAELRRMREEPVRQAKSTDARPDKGNKSAKAMTEKIRTLERRVTEMDAENRRLRKSLVRETEEHAALVRNLQEAGKKADGLAARAESNETLSAENIRLLEEKKAAEARVADLEAKLAASAEEARKTAEQIAGLTRKREDAPAGPGNTRTGDANRGPGEDIREQERELRELNEYARKARETEAEKKALEERWERFRQEKEKELQSLRAERDALRVQGKPGESGDKTVSDLRQRLSDTEKKYEEATVRLKALSEEKAAYDKQSGELQSLRAEADGLKDAYEREKAETKRLRADAEALRNRKAEPGEDDGQLKKMREEHLALRAAAEALEKKNRELIAENAPLRERLERFERPVVRIGEGTYSQARIDEDEAIADRVLKRVNLAGLSWRSGDTFRNFVAERVLCAKADPDEIQKKSAEATSLAKQYALSDRELDSLKRLLVADAVVKQRMKGPDEQEMKQYYEKNRNEFASGRTEKQVKQLVLPLASGDKRSSVQLVTELQRDALAGKPLEEIYRSHPDRVSYQQVRVEDLPTWVRDKIKGLREREVSNIFTEEQFMMLQPVSSPLFRKYEDARAEIRAKLTRSEKDLAGWLNGLLKEAVDLR